jgi:hypothetical protein
MKQPVFKRSPKDPDAKNPPRFTKIGEYNHIFFVFFYRRIGFIEEKIKLFKILYLRSANNVIIIFICIYLSISQLILILLFLFYSFIGSYA